MMKVLYVMDLAADDCVLHELEQFGTDFLSEQLNWNKPFTILTATFETGYEVAVRELPMLILLAGGSESNPKTAQMLELVHSDPRFQNTYIEAFTFDELRNRSPGSRTDWVEKRPLTLKARRLMGTICPVESDEVGAPILNLPPEQFN